MDPKNASEANNAVKEGGEVPQTMEASRKGEAAARVIPIAAAGAAAPESIESGLPHMIPKERLAAMAPLGVEIPESARATFRGTPFEDLYDEAVNLLRNRNITAEELTFLSRAIGTIIERRESAPFFVRQGKLGDVDALEGLVKYWARQGENLPRKRADIIRNIDSFAVCVRGDRMVGCASLFVYDSGLAEIRSLGVSPDVQRQGQGRAIVEYLLNRARRLDIDKVFVLTRSPKFFERCGFRLTTIDALPEKILKDCENCPKRDRCDELAYEYCLA